VHLTRQHSSQTRNIDEARRVLVIGTGDAGRAIVGAMQSTPGLGMLPVGFIDDQPRDGERHFCGLPVVGNLQSLATVAQSLKVEQIIIALPHASGKTIREIVYLCRNAHLPVSIAPNNGALPGNGISRNQIRNVQVEDLVRNEPIPIDTDGVRKIVAHRRVLVTGAGGSIGAELCRQITQYDPSELVLLGHGEHSIFTLASEFNQAHPHLRIVRVIADVRDADRLRRAFSSLRPEIVFHAAAHKHVPLMEENIEDAITNNVLGTSNVVKASLASEVENFILISTDKAVNPTNVMGATKRISELIVCNAAQRSARCYSSVRFGNVLGSRGSVLSIFQEQIARGGPLTVTHPEMRRYFMTIKEAVHLVLQAMMLGKGGEIFVFDMGDPINIADIARDVIELSGLQVGRDVEIKFTGIRPGEKLFEELSLQDEHYEPTRHQKIFVLGNGNNSSQATQSSNTRQPAMELDEQVAVLVDAALSGKRDLIRPYLKQIVPEYNVEDKPAEETTSRQPPQNA
jgi:FlaA1/EpsC-like NDP-sugar epimerase